MRKAFVLEVSHFQIVRITAALSSELKSAYHEINVGDFFDALLNLYQQSGHKPGKHGKP